MNLDPAETKIENLLRDLVPDAPSPALMERIDEELKLDMSWLNAKAPRRQVNWLNSVGWSAFGAAAAVAVMSFIPVQQQGVSAPMMAAVTPPPVVLPVPSTISEWEEPRNNIIRDASTHPSVQYVQVSTSDKHTRLTPRDKARITLEYMDEEKLAMPVNFLSEASLPLPGMPLYQQ